MIKIRVADVPTQFTLHHYAIEKYNLRQYWDMPIKHRPKRYFKYELEALDLPGCIAHADAIIERVGFTGFNSYVKETQKRSETYGGFSLTYNPARLDVSPHASSLGEVKYGMSNVFTSENGIEFFKWMEETKANGDFYRVVAANGLPAGKVWAEERGWFLPDAAWVDNGTRVQRGYRDGYFDTWRFTKLVPEVTEGPLSELIGSVRRTMVRSRCAVVRPETQGAVETKEFLWHSDEVLFTNFRLNIPLRTNSKFFLEDKELGRFDFTAGHGFSWNTEKLHRATWEADATGSRSALVIGTNPWFDYIEEEDAFVSNEFFGKKHPFDMLVDGDIIAVKSVEME